jgi:hypothetical protein
VNPPRNRKGESGSRPPTANASEFYPNRSAVVLKVTNRLERKREQANLAPELPRSLCSVSLRYLAIDTRKSCAGTVIVAPEKLHKRTSMTFSALTRIDPIKPGPSVEGQVGITGSSMLTPVRVMCWLSQRSFGICEKLREADLDNSK